MHPQGVTLRGGVPCVGTPEIKARRLACRYGTTAKSEIRVWIGISILSVPVGTVIHQATFRVDRMGCWPLLQAPDAVCGLHNAVELTGSGRVLGNFSDTSPCLCSFCGKPAPGCSPSACRHRQGPDPLRHRPEQASGRVALGQEPGVARVLHQPPTSVDKALLEAGQGPRVDRLRDH